MLRALFVHRVRGHALQVFRFLFPKGYDGEFFLCGGAFKPLLKKGHPMHDLDLWVRDRRQREKLCAALLERGAALLKDFHPFCLKFRLDGQLIEVTYHNVKDGSIADVLNTFDLAASAVGARFVDGRVVEAVVHDECWQAIRSGEVRVLETYLCFLALTKSPSLIRTLHRMGQKAAELDLEVNVDHEHRLWDLFWHHYTEDERRAAMDLYFDTMVAYKGQHDARLVHRATVGSMPVAPSRSGTTAPLHLTPQHA